MVTASARKATLKLTDGTLPRDTAERDESIQVAARERSKPFYSVNIAGEKVAIGRLHYRDYDGRARVPYLVTDDGTEHKLGAATTDFQVMDHWAVMEPLLAQGWVVQEVVHGRGGSDLFALMSVPNAPIIPDPITWDRSLYPDATETGMRMSIAVRSSARKGHGFSLVAGFFRMICTNGLMAKLLGLGDYRRSHKTLRFEDMLKWASGREEALERFLSSYSGVGTEALSFPIRLLDAMIEPEGKTFNLRGMPSSVFYGAQSLNKRIPAWGKATLRDNLKLLQSSQDTFSGLDLINAVTNVPALSAPSEAGFFRIYSRLDSLYEAMIELAAAGAMMVGANAAPLFPAAWESFTLDSSARVVDDDDDDDIVEGSALLLTA